MRAAGMIHTAESRSNSSHCAPISSLVRTKVSARSCRARLVSRSPSSAYQILLDYLLAERAGFEPALGY